MQKKAMIIIIFLILPLLLTFSKNIALLVGINQYRNLPSLRFAEKDARDLEEVLKSAGFDTFLLTGERIGREAILEEIRFIADYSSYDDTFLFFFSGHGAEGETESEKGLLTFYSDPVRRNGMVSHADLKETINKFKGKKIVVVDACNQGYETKSQMVRTQNIQSAVDFLLFSSAANQESHDGFREGNIQVDNGIAAYYIKRAIEGYADLNADNALTAGELKEYLTNNAQFYAKRNGQYMEVYNRSDNDKLIVLGDTSRQDESAYTSDNDDPEEVLVKGGTFRMGNTHGDSEGDSDEKPVHMVKLTYDYYIGKYEVTFNEYDAYCEATGKSKENDEGWGRGNRPVIWISWYDAIGYCNWLSEKEGLSKAYDSDGNFLDKNGRQTTDITQVEGYRLPTEAEWEYAARGGQQSVEDYKFAGSNDLYKVGWYWENSGDYNLLGVTDDDWDWKTTKELNCRTQEVGQMAPNELGLYDMSGNVWEWCHDGYDDYDRLTQTNPIGLSNVSSRVFRGGSWYGRSKSCRIANRCGDLDSRNQSFDALGFRIARTKK